MEYESLVGGGRMPKLGFGTWQLRGPECIESVRKAIEIGYRHLDTAQIYENEAEVGQAIHDAALPREELFVTTKLWMTNFKEEDALRSCEASLKALKLDYVNLLLMHWPNFTVPLAETLGAMQRLQREDKVKAIGVSNFPVSLMREAREQIGAPIACNQVEYHPMLSQAKVLEYARKHRIVVTAYSPLGRGEVLRHPVLTEIGRKLGKTPAQVALRWLTGQPGVAAIPKAASEQNARANFKIFDFTLSDADRQKIDALSGNNRLINPEWAPEWDAA